jgi:sugar phosphate isomerase/epimerase
MENPDKSLDKISRRKFIGSTSALAASAFLPLGFTGCLQAREKLSSNFGGVQIGVISYSFRSMPGSAEEILDYIKQIGLNSVELMGDPIERYAGAPQYEGPNYARGVQLTDQQRDELGEARRKHAEDLRKWRLSVSMEKFKELRKLYNNAGVNIDIAKLPVLNLTDEEVDYAFNAAKALGSRGISFEISLDAAKRMAPFAEKHGMYGIMHNHLQPGQPGFSFQEHLAFGKNLMLNFDVGHYYGATGLHPNGVIEKFHDRIASLHMKDKTGPNSNPANTNMPFGKGETPLADILLLLKKNKWPITADIELEYPIPDGSDAVMEVKKCVDYCKAILVA